MSDNLELSKAHVPFIHDIKHSSIDLQHFKEHLSEPWELMTQKRAFLAISAGFKTLYCQSSFWFPALFRLRSPGELRSCLKSPLIWYDRHMSVNIRHPYSSTCKCNWITVQHVACVTAVGSRDLVPGSGILAVGIFGLVGWGCSLITYWHEQLYQNVCNIYSF